MSIWYKLFGWPRTLEEFIDKIKKKGIEEVRIVHSRSMKMIMLDYIIEDEYTYTAKIIANLPSGKKITFNLISVKTTADLILEETLHIHESIINEINAAIKQAKEKLLLSKIRIND